jgi:hypothetical protein
MENVAVVVEDEPPRSCSTRWTSSRRTRCSVCIRHSFPSGRAATPADRISIYQRPILDACQTEDEVVATIGETVIHEVGHYFGLSEEELEAIEERYWRRQVRRRGGGR